MKYLITIRDERLEVDYERISNRKDFSDDEKIKIICDATAREPDEVDLSRFSFFATEINKIKKI